jgi:hypothetical protein
MSLAHPLMNKPHTITFTGIDPSNARAELDALLAADPRIELGILYSENRAGTDPRYPPFAWIEETAHAIAQDYGPRRLALHVCGQAVKSFIRGTALKVTIENFHRIQLNGAFDAGDIAALRQFRVIGNTQRYITQFDSNPELHQLCLPRARYVLFDSSGGRGIRRGQWPAPLPGVRCGYAGGLGPDNLRLEMPRIAAVAGPDYWVDMENSLRGADDRFSVQKARLALEAIVAFESEATGIEPANPPGEA